MHDERSEEFIIHESNCQKNALTDLIHGFGQVIQ